MARLLFFLFLFSTFLVPQMALAQVDSRCWKKDACIAARESASFGNMTKEEIEQGFIQSPEAKQVCGEKDAAEDPLGFCLPSTVAETKTTIGGKTVFTDIGEFIAIVYQYGIIAAAVLAILMIIGAGFMWATSGGNAERIGSAKKRIAGSMMGLLLAVLSYTLLNTLNPNLVNIRLPQIWMINTQGLAPPYCSKVTEGTRLALLGASNLSQEEKSLKRKNPPAPSEYTVSTAEATCGQDFFVDGTGGLSCTGDVCKEPQQQCFQYKAGPDNEKITDWRCVRSNLILSVKLDSFSTTILSTLDVLKAFLETVQNDWIDTTDADADADDPQIWPVCKGTNGILYRGDEQKISWNSIRANNGFIKTKGANTGINPNLYDYDFIFPPINLEDKTWCKEHENDTLEGIFVMIELKESGDVTDPDLWIGQASPKTPGVSYAKTGTWIAEGDRGNEWAEISFSDFIPKEHLEKGVILNVNVDTKTFQTIEQFTGSHLLNQMPPNEHSRPRCITIPPSIIPVCNWVNE